MTTFFMNKVTLLFMKIFFLFLLLAFAFYFIVYKARPAKNQKGDNINPPTEGFETQIKKQLTIGTYNVQTGKDKKGQRDIFRSAEIIKNADIVGIQEVYAASWLGDKSQTQQLAEHSAFGWLFAATRLRWLREHRGNALLSRLPIKKWSVEMLPDSTGKQFRNLIIAITELEGHDIVILVTHLHTKSGREQQLNVVLEKFKQYDRVILLGDMNTNIENHLIQDFLKDEQHIDAVQIALPKHDNNHRIDWILTKGFTIEDGHFEAIGVSDHPYYQVSLSLK